MGPHTKCVAVVNKRESFHKSNFIAQLSRKLLSISTYFLDILRPHLYLIPSDLLSLPPHFQEHNMTENNLPSPIIPIMTTRPRPLSAYLFQGGLNARPITWPTVPKGKDRVRVCLHAGHTKQDVEKLVHCLVTWATEVLKAQTGNAGHRASAILMESKL
jgi:8-amino-7-oxononanoate synthase